MANNKFDWDDGNRFKSVLKYGVTNKEATSCFINKKSITLVSEKQTGTEIRYIRIAMSKKERILSNIYVKYASSVQDQSMQKKNELTKKPTVRRKKEAKSEVFYTPTLPEHEKDMSHWIKPENLRQEAEEVVKRIMSRHK